MGAPDYKQVPFAGDFEVYAGSTWVQGFAQVLLLSPTERGPENLSVYSEFAASWRPFRTSDEVVPLNVDVQANIITVRANPDATRQMYALGKVGVLDVEAVLTADTLINRTFFWASTYQTLDVTR